MDIVELKGKRVLVVGSGISGTGAVKALCSPPFSMLMTG